MTVLWNIIGHPCAARDGSRGDRSTWSRFPQTETPAGKAGAQRRQDRELFGKFRLAATATDHVRAEARGTQGK